MATQRKTFTDCSSDTGLALGKMWNLRGLKSRYQADQVANTRTTVSMSRQEDIGTFQQVDTQDANTPSARPPNRLESQLGAQDIKLQELRDEHYTLLQSYGTQASKVKVLTEWKANAEKDLLALQNIAENLQQELQACKDDLFRLQPVVQTSDADIRNQYETVNQQISNWVDDEISQFEQRANKDAARNMEIVSGRGNPNAAELLRQIPEAGEYLIAYIIHAYIQENVFGKHIYSLGLPEDLTRTLKRIEHGMAKLEPSRGNRAHANAEVSVS